MYSPNFVVMGKNETLTTEVKISHTSNMDQDIFGYFEHEGKCVLVLLVASRRTGRPYWKFESSSKLHGIVCTKLGHCH